MQAWPRLTSRTHPPLRAPSRAACSARDGQCRRPPRDSGHWDLTVLAAGVVEIAWASRSSLPARRGLKALLAGGFVLAFPGNVAQYAQGADAFGLDTDGKRLARLFSKPVLVLRALWSGAWPRRRAPGGEQART